MFDEMYAPERDYSLSQMTQRPYEPDAPPGVFAGFGSAIRDAFPDAALTSASAWTALLDAYGKVAAYRDAPTVAAINHQPAPDLNQLEQNTIDQMGNSQEARNLRIKAKQFAPNPTQVGMAGQIAHGLISTLAKAGAYTVTTGPGAPAMLGFDVGTNEAQNLSDAGVDPETAALGGIATGLVSAAGLKIPASMGATRLQSMALGALVNPALGVADRATLHALLEHANYPQIAAQYKPLDPTQLAIEGLTGLAFGGIFHHTGRLTPEEHAALMTMNDVATRDADAMVKPEMNSMSDATDAQMMARAQMDSGQPVSVAHMIEPDIPSFDKARTMAIERMTSEMKAELLAEMGNRAAPGDIPRMVQERADIQQQLDHWNSDAGFKEEAKTQQQTNGLSRKQAESAARKVLINRISDLEGQASRLDQQIETNSKASKAEQDLADLESGKIPERFRKAIEDQSAEIVHSFQTRPIASSIRNLFNQNETETNGPFSYVPETHDMGTQIHDAQTTAKILHSVESGQPKPEGLGQMEGKAPEPGKTAVHPDTSETHATPHTTTPEIQSAHDAISENPDLTIRMEDGSEIRAADAMKEADETISKASKDSHAFKAAISCFLRNAA